MIRRGLAACRVDRSSFAAVALRVAVPAALALAAAAAGLRSQDEAPRKYQDGAKVEEHERMYVDKHAYFGPADGGGSARVVEGGEAVAGRASRYLLEYTSGELGIAAGGAIYLQVSPFWGWSTPQVHSPGLAGYTAVTTDAPGVTLESTTVGPQCLRSTITGAPLPPGAAVRFDFGCGEYGARVDTYAESEEAFYFWVDGDADGSRKLIGSDPRVSIAPGPAADLIVTAPSEAGVGASFDVVVAFLDAAANAAREFVGTVELSGDGLELPASVEFVAGEPARRRVQAKAVAAGLREVRARVHGIERASNPILVSERPRNLLWADLHGHSVLSDGTGTPEEYYAYAREVAALDVAVLTDHDHWGLRKLDQEPELWRRIRDATARANEPGRFTTLLGYEWTSWLFGHRHVLYFADEGEVLTSLDPPTDTPEGLWQALRERGSVALTIPHHPAGGPVPIDWSVAPDPDFEPVVEIASVHGTSEEPRGPRTIYAPVKGHFVRDALALGYRLGFVGSGDTHNGHPGLGHLGMPCGGVAAILAAGNTRESILAALRARTCYATTGARILLWFRQGEVRMGSVSPAPAAGSEAAEPPFSGLVIGTAPIARLDLVKNGEVVASLPGNGSNELAIEWRDAARAPGDWIYLRAVQADGHAAWASPIFTE